MDQENRKLEFFGDLIEFSFPFYLFSFLFFLISFFGYGKLFSYVDEIVQWYSPKKKKKKRDCVMDQVPLNELLLRENIFMKPSVVVPFSSSWFYTFGSLWIVTPRFSNI